MSYYEFPLTAGEKYRSGVSGKLILVDDIGAASGVDITPVSNGRELRQMPNRRDAFKIWIDYDDVIFESDVDTTVKVFLTDRDVSLGFANGTTVAVEGSVIVDNDSGDPVPVTVQGGVTLTATNVGINNNDAAAVPVKKQALTDIEDYAETTIGISAVSLINDATLRRLIFRNSSATATIALGGPSVTMEDSPLCLAPGESWIEDDAAGAHWYAIADDVGATIQLQGLK